MLAECGGPSEKQSCVSRGSIIQLFRRFSLAENKLACDVHSVLHTLTHLCDIGWLSRMLVFS
jgi:hypothetical protein